MKKLLLAILVCVGAAASTFGQSSPPITVTEADGSPRVSGVTIFTFDNGTVVCTGKNCRIQNSGGGGGSPGGSTTQVQYNNAGSFAGAAGFTFNGTSTVTLGVAGSSVGAVAFKNATSGTITLSPVTGALGTVTLSLPAATDTLVGRATTDTLTNKTLTTPTIGDFSNANHNHSNSAGGGQIAISSGISGLGTGVATALAVNVGSAGAFVTFNGAGGTPSSLTLTNATGLPPTTGISGWPANASGVLTNNGAGVLSWAAAGGSPGGSTTQLQYNNAGAFAGVSTLTTDGTIVTFAPTVTTGTGATSGVVFAANSLTTGTGVNFSSSSVTSGSVVNIASTSTAAASSTLKGLNIAISGANGTTAQTVTGAAISVTNTNATSGTNIGLLSIASGATTFNWAAQFQTGFVGFNLTGQSANRRAWAFDSGSGSNGIAFRRYTDNFGAGAATVWDVDNSILTDTLNIKASAFLTSSATATLSNARTPAQITADQNNYAPGVATVYRLSSDASRNITGFTTTANADGAYIELWNVGSQNIVLQNENASSTAANRFTTSTGADLTLSANKCAIGRYDATTSRWRIYLCN